ncbi:zincin-like metallopeptidase toxin domain-containing protein [Vagococcus entomophilus]|nr:zincin-like metallopeptidase toxin domain-containing protein [Vagococcus entomophilus]
MPDVKYTESSWEKTNQALSHLTGCYGIGVTEELKAVSRNLEEAEEVIRSYDEDRLIHFSHENHTSKYETLGEKLAVLQEFTTQVNGVLAEEIDDPFYKKIDAYIEAVRDLDISEYTTKNRLGITSKETIYGDGVGQTIEIEKTNIDLADIVNGKNFVGKLMNREWKSYLKNHPGGDKISYSEYQTAILHSGAFEYKSVKDGQQSKEMFFTVGAVTATVVVGIFCPPAGMALGVTLAGSEVISAANGKNLISGRELGTGERWTRGVLGVVGLGLGTAELRAFSKSVSMVKGTQPGTLENLTQMIKHSSRSSYKELQSTARNMSAVEKADGSNLDYRRINIQQNDIGERLATRKEIRSFKKKFGQNGVKLTIDKKGKILPANVDGGFNFKTGKIVLPKNPTQIALHHEGFHAEQWLNIGQDAYAKLAVLEREEHVFEQIMKNQHLFDDQSIIHSIEYIERLRLKLK